jgi:hypothetical protein
VSEDDSKQPQTMPQEVALFAEAMMALFESADRNGISQAELARRCGYSREWVNKTINNVFIPLHQGVPIPLPKWEVVNNFIDAIRPQDERSWMGYERRKLKIRALFDEALSAWPREYGSVRERQDTAKRQAVRLPKSQPLETSDPDSEADMPDQETIRRVLQETGQQTIEKEVLDLQQPRSIPCRPNKAKN